MRFLRAIRLIRSKINLKVKPDIDDGDVGTTMKRKELSGGDVRDASRRHLLLSAEKRTDAFHHRL